MKTNIALSIFLICGIMMGIAGTILYYNHQESVKASNYTRTYNGLYTSDNYTQPQAISNAQQFDTNGNWVCVNVKGMNYQTAVNTCNHEVGHEIFAVYCQNHIEQCVGITNGSSS